MSALCRIQKPPKIYLEKSLHDILYHTNKPCPGEECCCPGDRDDNLWITFNNYQPPKTQTEWEQTCFLDKCFHGYYKWPKIIKYTMNKRERYTKETMSEHVAVIYNRFIDKAFVIKLIQFMIIEDEENEVTFNIDRCRMFKVRSYIVKASLKFNGIISLFRKKHICYRVFFEILVWI